MPLYLGMVEAAVRTFHCSLVILKTARRLIFFGQIAE